LVRRELADCRDAVLFYPCVASYASGILKLHGGGSVGHKVALGVGCSKHLRRRKPKFILIALVRSGTPIQCTGSIMMFCCMEMHSVVETLELVQSDLAF